jgi:acetyl esterase/lipase
MRIFALLLSKLLLAAVAAHAASTPEEVFLWPQGAPGSEGKIAPESTVPARDDGLRRISTIHKPSLTVHLPAKEKATGAAVIILPGGGHRHLAIDNEGNTVAGWLSERGIAGLVLKYRLAREEGSTYKVEEHAVADAQRAVRVARSRAKGWGLDPERIGMLGISAGGQLVFHAATRYDAGQPEAADAVDRSSSRPAFFGLLYSGSALSPEAEIPKDAPPAFLCVAFDDKGPTGHALTLFHKLRDTGVSAELHVYARGGHGFGMKDRPLPVTGWISRFHEWVVDQVLKAPTS